MAAKHLYLPECETLLWFPPDPHFNQWLTKKTPSDYGISLYHPGFYTPEEGQQIKYILVNWSNKRDVYAFGIVHSVTEFTPLTFYASPVFKYLKTIMDGITMRGGFLMIDRPEDVVMFRIMFGEQL